MQTVVGSVVSVVSGGSVGLEGSWSAQLCDRTAVRAQRRGIGSGLSMLSVARREN